MRPTGPRLSRFSQSISAAAHGIDELVVPGRLQLLAQAPDMHVDGALLDEYVVAPDLVEELGARVDALGMGHEEMQQAELGGPELDDLAVGGHAARRRIEAQPADLDHVVGEL